MPEISIPYDEIDPSIVSLVFALNDLEGITTGASCGGHDDPDFSLGQSPSGQWSVIFLVDHTEDGWYSLTFLSYVCHELQKSAAYVSIVTFVDDLFLTSPEMALGLNLAGLDNVDPEEVAGTIERLRRELYRAPGGHSEG